MSWPPSSSVTHLQCPKYAYIHVPVYIVYGYEHTHVTFMLNTLLTRSSCTSCIWYRWKINFLHKKKNSCLIEIPPYFNYFNWQKVTGRAKTHGISPDLASAQMEVLWWRFVAANFTKKSMKFPVSYRRDKKMGKYAWMHGIFSKNTLTSIISVSFQAKIAPAN